MKITRVKKIISSAIMFLALCIVFSCTQKKAVSNEKPVAKVFEEFLYPSDLKNIVPLGFSQKDSAALIKNFIEKWIQTQLVLKHSEKNLTTEQLSIEKELKEYRKNLIIYNYQTELIHQKLDTIVSKEEIEKFYNEHLSQFTLKDNIVKVYYVKVSKTAPNIEKVRKWYISSQPKDIELLKSYCIQFAENSFIDDETWLLFDDLLKEVPIQNYNSEHFLQNTRAVEVADSSFKYFLNIKGFKTKNSVSPIGFETENIRNIVINKRKLKLIDEMKRQVYADAKENNNFEIY